jgi:hypothetical protein
LFIRDEAAAWRKVVHPNGISPADFRAKVDENIQQIVDRVKSIYQWRNPVTPTANQSLAPICQPAVDLIKRATDPLK